MIILKRIKIAILGSNGFIGRGLQSHFNNFDFEVMPFSSKNMNNAIQWDYKSKIPEELFENKKPYQVIINDKPNHCYGINSMH